MSQVKRAVYRVFCLDIVTSTFFPFVFFFFFFEQLRKTIVIICWLMKLGIIKRRKGIEPNPKIKFKFVSWILFQIRVELRFITKQDFRFKFDSFFFSWAIWLIYSFLIYGKSMTKFYYPFINLWILLWISNS